MRRLSIIDLDTGHQPIHNEDGSVWIVYNGEVYNFRELRADLLSRNHRFSTRTDTEVIVHLYEDHGEECVRYLRGMFALAIWDERKRKFFMARDRLGIKPLYYFLNDRQIVFASEMKSILAIPGIPRDIEMEGLLHYLQFGYIPDPYSIFRHIKKLPPGSFLSADHAGVRVERFWKLNFGRHPVGEGSALLEKSRELLQESVRMRLISDVPLGAFLSGGVDSSTIVALMSMESNEPVKTFSIGFEEPQFNELSHARAVAEHFHTDHHEMIVRPGSIDLIDTIIRSFDEPFGDPSAIPTYFVSKMAAGHVKVVLSGDGGDELFGGYDSYAAILQESKYERLPDPVRKILGRVSDSLPYRMYGRNYLQHIMLSGDERFLNYVSHMSHRKHVSLLSKDLQTQMKDGGSVLHHHLKEAPESDLLSRMQYLDFNCYLPGDILVKVDRMSMAHSLEVRIPFLDHVLVDFMATLPPKWKLCGGERKILLKRLASKLLPTKILTRAKQGFGVPLRHWFKEDLNSYLKEVLFDRRTVQRGYFNIAGVEALLKEHLRGRRDHSALLWHLLVLELWHRIYTVGVPE
jgi:asparagine synthase (glutamine-hydrolysing)